MISTILLTYLFATIFFETASIQMQFIQVLQLTMPIEQDIIISCWMRLAYLHNGGRPGDANWRRIALTLFKANFFILREKTFSHLFQ